jgi:DNA-binding NarL/FixJ family response regulator
MRILIADDHEVVRQGLRALVERDSGMTVCGEAVNGRVAVEMAVRLLPDLVILDVSMPEINGVEAARQIRRKCPRVAILMLTMHESDALLEDALALGVRGFVLKSDAAVELIAAIQAVTGEKFFVSSGVAANLVGTFLADATASRARAARKSRLTAREREIVQLLAEGKTSKEIASILQVAVKTIETHRANIFKKLGAHSIADVVRYAIRNKIVQP